VPRSTERCGFASIPCRARLFLFAARPWLAHFDRLDVATLEHWLAVLVERLAFAVLLLGAFAAGSMGTFLLFSWPASSGSMILGYLWATLVIRLSHTVSRFFLAPGAERLRLVPLTTRRAWFWHRWMGALTAIGALGWQTIVVLHPAARRGGDLHGREHRHPARPDASLAA
jgi:hypothetical protein